MVALLAAHVTERGLNGACPECAGQPLDNLGQDQRGDLVRGLQVRQVRAPGQAPIGAVGKRVSQFGAAPHLDRDVKLAAVAGTWLGLATIFAVIELAALSALGAYLINSMVQKRPLKATAFLPFGVFLAPAIWIGWLVEAIVG